MAAFNVGGAGPISHLTCNNAATGQRVWQQLRFGKGNLIAADGKLFIATINGELVVVRASRTTFEPVRRYKVSDGETWTPPVLSGRRIFVKDVSTLAEWTVN